MEEIINIYNESFRFDISISDRCYDHKPTARDYQSMSFIVAKSISVDDLLELLKKGHSICHIFSDNKRKKGCFLYTFSVFFDIDDSNVCMTDFIERCAIKPTMAYTTASNGEVGKGFRFRLIYVFNDKITTEALYKSIYSYVLEQNNMKDTKDKCGSVCNQLMNGNSKSNIETYCSHIIYKLDSELFSKCSLELTTLPSPHYYSKEHFEKKDSIPNEESNCQETEKGKVADIIASLMSDARAFLAFYDGKIEIIQETNIEYNDEGYGFFPDDYYRLFHRYSWKEKKIRKFKDHEKRRNRLYVDACLMRRIKPEASFLDLLYNLVFRRQLYYDNSDGVLTNNILVEIVLKVLNLDSSVI